MRLTPEQKEIITFLITAADGEITEQQCARVEQLVKESGEMQSFVLQLLNQEAWLSLHSLHGSTSPVRAELATRIRELLTAAEASTVSQALADQRASSESFAKKTFAGARRWRGLPVARRSAGDFNWQSPRKWPGSMVYAAVLLGIGMAIGVWINQPSPLRDAPAIVVGSVPGSDDLVGRGEVVAANYEARLVQYTSCVWGQEIDPRSSGRMRSGDPLNLIYGLAELELGWSTRGKVRVRLEGPAGIVLMTHGEVNLNRGKLTANVALEDERFAVETPLGRVEVAEDASIGVAASPNSVEVHVFSGEAKVVTSWTTDSLASNNLVVDEGQSIQLVATEDGAVTIGRDIAAPSIFVSQIPLTDDLLDISASYIAAIKDAAPLVYWRFNPPVDGLVRNEMGDRYHGQALGHIDWVQEHDNWTIHCGNWLATDMPASHVVADRSMQSVGVQGYSLEVWVKPSHAHLATLASLLIPHSKERPLHGMLLELGGPSTVFTGREHPGRVRFLHRNPAGEWGGNSCFSNRPYGLRKWQHIAAVKNRSEMRLYIDGKQLGRCKDATPLPDGLLLLVGQLGQKAQERVFVGQLDELAYYERELSQEEIEQHYRLVRPTKALLTGI